MIEIFVDSVGIAAPGLVGWTHSRLVFNGTQAYVHEPLPQLVPEILPATERRRCIPSARLALTTSHEALSAIAMPAALACVFASSDGDGQVIHQIAEGLAQDEPDVSPTRFSNSVHNAAVGYWSIAAGLKQASTMLCGYDHSFAAALLEAAAQCADEQTPVLLTAFDMRFPDLFVPLRPTAIDCSVSLIFMPQRSTASIACLQVELGQQQEATAQPACLPADFASNPAARALPLLAAMAAPEGQTIALDYPGRSLSVKVVP